jgi:hypothetical protein
VIPVVSHAANRTALKDHALEIEADARHAAVTETSSAEAAQATEQTHLDLTVTPAASPGWAVSVGLEDVLGQRPMRAALRRRLFGPIWVEASAIPSRMQFGAAVAVEW